MNLKEIRQKVVELSGRYDLVVDTTDYVDNGADFFIQEASRFLDRRSPEVNEDDSAFYPVAAGVYHLKFATIRSIKEVWYYGTESRVQLIEVNKNKLKELFSSILISTNRGIPAYYAPVKGRLVAGTIPVNFLNGLKLASEDINGIIFSPVDPAGTLEIVGKFYSDDLVECDENYWSIHHAMLLVWATLYLIEISYRNSEGARDWLAAINGVVTDLDMDVVEERTNNRNQMGGKENE